MNVRYRVELSQAELSELTAMWSKGKRAARKLKRAQILLAADAGHSDEEIARTVAVGGSTVYRTKRRFVEGNLERALSEESASWGGAQAHRQGRSLAGGNGLRKPSRGSRPLDAGTAGRRHGQAHPTPEPVGRDGTPATGRKRSQALAQGYVVHSPRQRLAENKAADHGIAERLAQFRAGTRSEHQRHPAEQRRHRRHHNRSEPQQTCLADRVEPRQAAVPLRRDGEIDHHDSVLL